MKPTETNDGGPACARCGALDLRDWFAGQAMAGMLANTNGIQRDGESLNGRGDFADAAFAVADAMLAAREVRRAD